MKYVRLVIGLLLLSLVSAVRGQDIRIGTDATDLLFRVSNNGRLQQLYLGKKLSDARDFEHLRALQQDALITYGTEDLFEPALRITHADGNPSLLLKYVSYATVKLDENISTTTIVLQDEKYPVTVKLFFTTYQKENVITTHTEVSHKESRPILLYNYASSCLSFSAESYWLTQFCGEWTREATMEEMELKSGKKVIDSRLGGRADMFASPFFMLALDKQADEDGGKVLLGSIAWTGNFRFVFEKDNTHRLRVISGINPSGAEYPLQANSAFATPQFVFTFSTTGIGDASRNLHAWARMYQVKDGTALRMSLLNNWEATYFDFDEAKLLKLIDDASQLGVDMFLLDDGWFGNKYPRNNDEQGLGDWQENKLKLPNGLGRLTEEAVKKGVKFGLWIEPEMVNPRSELYEKHKDWVLHFPNREDIYCRNQMVLDLCNPDVQQYVFSLVDNLLSKYPDIAYFKWDCNSTIANIFSAYLKKEQSKLYVDYVKGLYSVLDRIKQKYPLLPMMLCAGGGGRTDYKALQYFTEFWPSDNTGPAERIFIQWGYSHFFPSKTLCAHITSWGNEPFKFRTDVAMMGKLGFDIEIDKLSPSQLQYAKQSLATYQRLCPVIWEGDMYRLASPYEGNHAALSYVDTNKKQVVVFAFDIYTRHLEKPQPVCLKGLLPDKRYKVEEINLYAGQQSGLAEQGKVLSGDYLMNVGIQMFSSQQLRSCIIEITEVD